MEHSWSSSLYTIHIRHTNIQTNYISTFADNTAIFATHEDSTLASLNLQEQLYIIEKWIEKWKIKVNESKSLHIMLPSGKATALQSVSNKLSYLKQKE
jgi:outer membrane translocation and assembly module TamA